MDASQEHPRESRGGVMEKTAKTQCQNADCKAEVGEIEAKYSKAHGFQQTLCFPCANKALFNLAILKGTIGR